MSKATTDLKKFTGGLQDTQKSAGGLVRSFVDVKAAFGTVMSVGRRVVDTFADAVQAASDLEEQTSKFNTVFSTSADVMDAANNTVQQLTQSYAMSEREARQYMSSMQDLLVPLGILPEKAVNLSSSVVKLAADLGSFSNRSTEEAMRAIQSAMVGNTEAMRSFSVVLNEGTIKQEAFRLGLWSGTGELTASAKAQAVLSASIKQSSFAIGDMERTSGGWANTMKAASATVEDFQAAIGKPLIESLLRVKAGLQLSREEAVNFGAGLGAVIGKVAEGAATFYGAYLKMIYYASGLVLVKKGVEALGKFTRDQDAAKKKLAGNLDQTTKSLAGQNADYTFG